MNPDSEAVTEQLLVQAEKFKAKVEALKGNQNFVDMFMPYDYDRLRNKFVRPEELGPIDSEILFLRNFDQDDEFFHVTSQIDPILHVKIERGEYIELERLLPKDRFPGRTAHGDINKQLFQLITQGTSNYLEMPATRTGKLNSICKWDQAFRVFAAIYTRANPKRASEIWQYVYVIHTAAAANPLDNVHFYDVNFQQLMANKPWKSWGKTYTQGWNMAFNNVSGFQATQSTTNSSSNSFSKGSGSGRSWKDDCCWRFNKNRCKRMAGDCNYDHRCTFCAGWNHGFHNCRKRKNRSGSGQSFGSGDKSSATSNNKNSNPKRKDN